MALRNLNESYSGGRRSGGTPFAGIAAADIPSTGLSGPSFLYPLIAMLSIGPAVQLRGFLAASDPDVTISANENGEFEAEAAVDGTYLQYFTLFLDGVQFGAVDDYYFTLTFADGVLVSPSPAALMLVGYVPALGRTGHASVAPGVASLLLAGLAPVVARSTGATVVPGSAEVGLVGLDLSVEQTAHRLVEPSVAAIAVLGLQPAVGQSSSGGVADPAAVWAYVLPNGMTAADTLLQVQAQLLDLYRIHGLAAGQPLVVTPASREAGPVQQSIDDAGGTVTVTRL